MLSGLWHIAEGASPIEALRRMSRLGFHYVDLHAPPGDGLGPSLPAPRHLPQRERLALAAELDRLGLEARNYVLHPLHNIPEAAGSRRDENVAYMREGIAMAAGWGIRQVMLNAGRWVYGMARQEAWSRSVGFLQEICDCALERDIYIAQETEPYVWFLVNDLAAARAMAADVMRPNFATLLDLGHMALARESAAEMYGVADTVIHAHISDHEESRHTNQVVGTGCLPTVDYLIQLKALEDKGAFRRFGYEEVCASFELGMPGDTIADPDDWARRSIEHVLRVAPYVRL
jgi:sugar phosphate isomerase/epimerase